MVELIPRKDLMLAQASHMSFSAMAGTAKDADPS